MATISGSHFIATAPGQPVNAVFDTGAPLPPTIPGAFNLEVFVGTDANAPSLAAGYQGLAVLSPGGWELDLITGAYAVTDNGTGGDMLNAEGSNETIIGGAAFSSLILTGNNDAAQGGAGGNYIAVNGTGDTVLGGAGPDGVTAIGNNESITGGSGPDTITAIGNNESITGGGGPDTITAIGNNESITGGSGSDLVNAVGTGDTITAGSGGGTFNVFGAGDTVNGGLSSDTIGLYSNDDVANGGAGGGSIMALGSGDTVNAGAGNLTVTVGGNFQFNDNSGAVYNDTVVGFSNAAGDHIHLAAGDTLASTTVVNGGQDTLITLSDNSTILLKGITNINNSFFN